MTSPAINLADLKRGRDKAAFAVAHYGEQYLPIFERIEREIADLELGTTLARALEIGTRIRPQNGPRIAQIRRLHAQ